MRQVLSLSQWETRVSDLFNMARLCRMTHADLLARTSETIHAELSRKHGKRAVYSQYVAGYVAGLMQAARADLYRNHLEFCYLVEGVLYSTHKTSTHRLTEEFYARGEGHILGKEETPGCHYWKGSDKPF